MTRKALTISLLLMGMMSIHAQAANIYRYKNNNGKVVYDSTVPAEFVNNGYEILNEKGEVIKVVPRALTEEELAREAEQKEQQRLAAEARAKQEEEDKLLLRLYRHPDEISRMRDDKVEELDAQITALSAMVTKDEEQLASLEETVEKNKAAGIQPPDTILSKMEIAERDRVRLLTRIEKLRTEREETIVTAERHIKRLRELLNL